MEADVALSAGAGEGWKPVAPVGQKKAKSKSGKGQGLPQRRGSRDDQLEATSSSIGKPVPTQQKLRQSSSREKLNTASTVSSSTRSGSAARRGSGSNPHQSPVTPLANEPLIGSTKSAPVTTPKEQKKSSSRNRRRRAAAARRQEEEQGGEGTAPDVRHVTTDSANCQSSEGVGKDGRRSRKNSQQSDEGLLTCSLTFESKDLKSNKLHSSHILDQKKLSSTLPKTSLSGATTGFGYHGQQNASSASERGRHRRRDKGATGRVVPKQVDTVTTDTPCHSIGQLGTSARDTSSFIGEEMADTEALFESSKHANNTSFGGHSKELTSDRHKLMEPMINTEILELPSGYFPSTKHLKSDLSTLVDVDNFTDTPLHTVSIPPQQQLHPSISDFQHVLHPMQTSSNVLPNMNYVQQYGVIPQPFLQQSQCQNFNLQPNTSHLASSSHSSYAPLHSSVAANSQPTNVSYQGISPYSGISANPSEINYIPTQYNMPMTFHNVPHCASNPRASRQHMQSNASEKPNRPDSVPMTHLTFSPQLSQLPLMSAQTQALSHDKSFPLDLSFSPRNNSPAYAQLFQQAAIISQPEPAHSPRLSTSPNPDYQNAVSSSLPKTPNRRPGCLRQPNLSALGYNRSQEEAPLDLSLKKTPSNTPGVVASKMSPETPSPIDLRTNVPINERDSLSVSSHDGWQPTPSSYAIINQPKLADVSTVNNLGLSSQNLQVREEQNSTTAPQNTDQEYISLIRTKQHPQELSKFQFSHDAMQNSSIEHPLQSESTAKATPENQAIREPMTFPETLDSGSISHTQTTAPKTEHDTSGFLNKNEILQQKAGIKHDDIVVGPRRPASALTSTKDTSEAASCNMDNCLPFNTFPLSHSRLGAINSNTENVCEKSQSDPTQVLPCNETIDSSDKTNETLGETHKDQQSISPSSNGSQTIPRRIPRKVEVSQDASPQTSRRKVSGPSSRLPKPLHAPSPERATGFNFASKNHKTDPELLNNGEEIQVEEYAPSSNICSPASLIRASDQSVYQDKLETNMPESSLDNSNVSSVSIPPINSKSRLIKANKSCLPKSTTPPTKRKELSGKLHMLSNIPVPMCHDPRPKHVAPPLQDQQTDKEKDEEEEHVGDKTPLLAQGEILDSFAKFRQTEQLRDPLNDPSALESTPQLLNVCSDSCVNAVVDNVASVSPVKEHSGTNETQLYDKENKPLFDTSESVKFEQEASTNEPNKLPTQREYSASISVDQSKSTNEKNTSSADQSTLNNQAIPEELSSPPRNKSPASEKPRLHRSAEHLSKYRIDLTSLDPKSLPTSPRNQINSGVNVLSTDSGHPSTSSARALFTSNSMDIEKSPSIVKKKSRLRGIGILRRASERTAEYTQRTPSVLRRGYEIGHGHDPSVEDLKRATSISELCQSVASLLNIDNEKAAAMITGELSTRTDLVEGLDADAIIDYLCHHGVLDSSALPEIDAKSKTPSKRNLALLRQVEARGTTAVALFVNALRQSGQLHLASSLDTEPRIRPSAGGGYFGKGRHKGEVTVRIQIEWLKILAPPEPVKVDKNVDPDLLKDATVVTDDEDDVKSRCWCFCRRSKVKSRRKKSKHDATSPVSSSGGGSGDRGKSKENSKKKNKKSSQRSSQYQDDLYPNARYGMVGGNGEKRDKSGGVIMEFDPALELVTLKSGQPNSQNDGQQVGSNNQGILIEQWRCWGPHFQRKASALCARLCQSARDDLVKYFEQDRSTLVLDVVQDGGSLCVVNICMMGGQVRQLVTDVENTLEKESEDRLRGRDLEISQDGNSKGKPLKSVFEDETEELSLLDRLEAILFSHVDIKDFDIRGIKLKLTLDKGQVDAALSELS